MRRYPAKLTHRLGRGAVDRERLFALIDREAERPLLWVQGPAGAGKTVLVASYLARRRVPALWYHVDDADVDAPTVFSYLAQGAAAITRKRRPALPALTPEYLLDQPGFARRFFRLFFEALPARAALVFDAFENAPGTALQELLRVAAEEVPAGQRLIVTSRSAPPPALAHWQATGAMAVLPAEELQLTADEAAAIAARGSALPPGQWQALHAAAEGWAAGFVVLLAHARRTGGGVPGGAAVEPLVPYYLNELFAHTEPAVQAMLLRTALLPSSFTARQAAALAPLPDAEAVLQWLLQRHFFITCGSGGAERSYTYHPLFRQFLVEQGRALIAPEERRTLLRQAAGLLAAADEPEAALQLLIEAQQRSEAAALLCRLAPQLLRQGRLATLVRLVAALPAGEGEGEGRIEAGVRFWHGMALLLAAPQRARPELEAAYAGFERAGDADGELLACAAILESYLHGWSDMRPVDGWAAILQRLLQGRPGLAPETEVRVLASMAVLILRGHRHAALVDAGLARARALLVEVEDAAQRLNLAGFVVIVLYLRGEWREARRFVDEMGPRIPPPAVLPQLVAFWHTMKGRVLIWNGESEAAFAALAEAERVAAEHNLGALVTLIASAGVFAALNVDDPERAEAGLQRMRAGLLPARRVDVATLDLQSGMVALARGQARRAAADLAAAVEKADELGAELQVAQFRIVQALALAELGDHAGAAAALQRAADYAEAARTPMLAHAVTLVRAWLAQRAGALEPALVLLRQALAAGREGGFVVVFPWVPAALLQDLGLLALRHAVEPELVREMIRLRRVPPPAADAGLWPRRVRVRTLGRFEVTVDEQPLPSAPKAPKRPLELLRALVALGSPNGVAQGALQQVLWPDLDGAAAQNAFNIALHRLRRLLGDEQAVVLHDGRLQLDPERVWTDVGALLHLADAAAEAEPAEAAEALLRLYAGHFLADDEAPWSVLPRERLRSRFLRAAAVLAERLEAAGRLEAAIDLQRRVIELDPVAEAFHRALMRCLHALGRSAEALEAYERCRQLLWTSLHTPPSEQTEQLRKTIGM